MMYIRNLGLHKERKNIKEELSKIKITLAFSVIVTTSLLKESAGWRPRLSSFINDPVLGETQTCFSCKIIFFHHKTANGSAISKITHDSLYWYF